MIKTNKKVTLIIRNPLRVYDNCNHDWYINFINN